MNPYTELKTSLSDELWFVFLLGAVPREKSTGYVMASAFWVAMVLVAMATLV
jgi:hypothetical protein